MEPEKTKKYRQKTTQITVKTAHEMGILLLLTAETLNLIKSGLLVKITEEKMEAIAANLCIEGKLKEKPAAKFTKMATAIVQEVSKEDIEELTISAIGVLLLEIKHPRNRTLLAGKQAC